MVLRWGRFLSDTSNDTQSYHFAGVYSRWVFSLSKVAGAMSDDKTSQYLGVHVCKETVLSNPQKETNFSAAPSSLQSQVLGPKPKYVLGVCPTLGAQEPSPGVHVTPLNNDLILLQAVDPRILLLLFPPDWQCQIDAHEIHRGKGLHIRLSLAVALNSMPVTSNIWLVSSPILRENTLGVVRGLSSPSTSLTRGLVARRLFRVPSCRVGTIHLQTSMPSPGFEPRPYGTAGSVTNHFTGWAAIEYSVLTSRTPKYSSSSKDLMYPLIGRVVLASEKESEIIEFCMPIALKFVTKLYQRTVTPNRTNTPTSAGGPRHFEPGSSDEEDTCNTTPTEERFSSREI
ncbi:hypothetical protein TNCV_1780011 [Trichonephila clavipes]|nr:hypothetical protein TNCV_1780011 [Trichonephila clavipes]